MTPFKKKVTKTNAKGQEEAPVRKTRSMAQTKDKEKDSSSDHGQRAEQEDRDKPIDEITKIMEQAEIEKNLIDKVRNKCTEVMAKMTEDQLKRIRKAWKTEQDREEELRNCERSVIIHDADKLVDKYMIQEDEEWDSRYTLAEKTAGVVTNLTHGMVMVTEAFALGQRSEDKTPTSICLQIGRAHV